MRPRGLSLKRGDDGHIKLVAPGTPFDEVDLSDSFLALPAQKITPKRGRRLYFVLGGLIGALVAWLLTDRALPGQLDLMESIPGLPDMSLGDLSGRLKVRADRPTAS